MDATAYLDASLAGTSRREVCREERLRLDLARQDLSRLWEWGGDLPEPTEIHLLTAAAMTQRAAQRGIVKPRGDALGYGLWRHAPEEDLLWMVRSFVAAALDFHLDGGELELLRFEGDPVAGAMLSLPLVVVSEGRGKPPRAQAQALATALLVAGSLNPSAGKEEPTWEYYVAVAAGCAAGLVRLEGGDTSRAAQAIATLVGSALGAKRGVFSSSWAASLSTLAGLSHLAAQAALMDRGIDSDLEESRRILAEWRETREQERERTA